MALSREILEREIIAATAAIKGFKESVELHGFVLKGLKEELEKLPKKA